MVNLGQVIKDLRTERSRAQKELDRLEKAIGALEKLVGNRGRQVRKNERVRKRKLSAAVRRKMAEGQRARWAKLRQQKTASH